MGLTARLSALAIAGFALTATPATGAASAPHGRAITAGTVARAVAVSPSGSTIFVTGAAAESTPKPHHDGLTVAYNATTGAVLWRALYHPVRVRFSGFSAVAASPDGSMVFATGEVQRLHQTQPRFLTVAYNAATGAKIWSDTEDVFGTASAIAVSHDGSTVFVTGQPAPGFPATVAYKAANGSPLWTQSGGLSSGVSIAVAPDGSAVFATGTGLTAGSSATVAYNPANGVPLWTAPAAGAPAAIAVNPVGSSAVVTGTGPAESDTQAYNAATGAKLWLSAGLKTGASVAVSPDGSAVFVTGTILGISGSSTIAYNAATGAMLWETDTPSRAVSGVSLAVSPGGSTVFVTGLGAVGIVGVRGANTSDYTAATGRPGWSTTDNSLTPYDLALSPDGSEVFVTGTLSHGKAYDTVAYSADNGTRLWQRAATAR